MYGTVGDEIAETLREIRAAGLYKAERQLAGPQGATVSSAGAEVLNFCANNYLGLADHPSVLDAARSALDDWGFGMASVRFICGTQTQHAELERRISAFLHTEATILYSSCFDANGGTFEVLLDEARRGDLRRTSTTPRSSTACGCARPPDSVTATGTWPICAPSCRPPRARAGG